MSVVLGKLFGRAPGYRKERVVTAVDVLLEVRVECAYSDGHESSRSEAVVAEPFTDLEDLWDQLFDLTGDGHGDGRDLGCLTVMTILEAAGRPELVGLSHEWA